MFRKTYKVVVLAIVLGVLLNACSKRQAVTEEYNTSKKYIKKKADIF